MILIMISGDGEKKRFQYWTKSVLTGNYPENGTSLFSLHVVDLSGIFAHMNRPRIYWNTYLLKTGNLI